jgi:hypothetical protein
MNPLEHSGSSITLRKAGVDIVVKRKVPMKSIKASVQNTCAQAVFGDNGDVAIYDEHGRGIALSLTEHDGFLNNPQVREELSKHLEERQQELALAELVSGLIFWEASDICFRNDRPTFFESITSFTYPF